VILNTPTPTAVLDPCASRVPCAVCLRTETLPSPTKQVRREGWSRMTVTASAVLWFCFLSVRSQAIPGVDDVNDCSPWSTQIGTLCPPPNPNPSRNSSGAMHTRHVAGAMAGDPSSGIEGLGGRDRGTNPDIFFENPLFCEITILQPASEKPRSSRQGTAGPPPLSEGSQNSKGCIPPPFVPTRMVAVRAASWPLRRETRCSCWGTPSGRRRAWMGRYLTEQDRGT